MNWLRNAWYQAGWSDEIDSGRTLCRTLLDEPVLFYRKADGGLAALLDRCPHRFAPLSAGHISGDVVTCGYHGLAFGPDGACRHNPHGAVVSRLRVRAFPVAERHRAIWIWMGEPERADRAAIPQLGFIDDAPETARIAGYIPTACDYRLLIDNIMDLSHADYLHAGSLGGMMSRARTSCVADGDGLVAAWTAPDCVPPPAFVPMVPGGGNADIRVEARWRPPGVMVVNVQATATGTPQHPDGGASTLHSMTPESAGTSHYFFCSTRRFMREDAAVNAHLREALTHVFRNEDKPMLERQQARIGSADFWSLSPVMLGIDTAAVQVRRKLEAMVAAEAAARG